MIWILNHLPISSLLKLSKNTLIKCKTTSQEGMRGPFRFTSNDSIHLHITNSVQKNGKRKSIFRLMPVTKMACISQEFYSKFNSFKLSNWLKGKNQLLNSTWPFWLPFSKHLRTSKKRSNFGFAHLWERLFEPQKKFLWKVLNRHMGHPMWR